MSRCSTVTTRVAVVLAVALIALAALSASQASAATLYVEGDTHVGSIELNSMGAVTATNLTLTANACASAHAFDVNSTGIFYANGTNVCRTNLDGTSLNSALLSGGAGCSVYSLHVTEQYIYYVCHDSRWVGRADIDGTNNDQHFVGIPVGAPYPGSFQYPSDITTSDNWIYVGNDGFISRAPIDGGVATLLFLTGTGDVRGLDVDGGHLYWTRLDQRTIARAGLDGAQVNTSFVSTTDKAYGVVVDGLRMHWLTRVPGVVGQALLDGTHVNTSLVTGITANGQNHQIAELGGPAKVPLGAAISNSASPTASGTGDVNSVLTATTGTWSSTPTETYYQWQKAPHGTSAWSNIISTDAATATYTVKTADIGSDLRVQIRAGTGGLLTSAASIATTVIAPPAPTNTVLPAIAGTPVAGQGIVGTTGTWTDATGSITYAYQWETSPDGQAPWTNATGVGAESRTYVAALSDASRHLRLKVTADNGSSAVAYSADVTVAAAVYGGTRISWKWGSILSDGSGATSLPGCGVWGFATNGTTNVWGDWNQLKVGTPNQCTTLVGPGGQNLTAGQYATAIAIDSQYIYFDIASGSMRRVGIDGTGLQTEFIQTGCSSTITGVTLDARSIYFACDQKIKRASLAGGASTTVVSGLPSSPSGVAVDSDHLYWTNASSGASYIARADIGGGAVEQQFININESNAGLYGVAVDATGVYWTKNNAGRGLGRANLDGSAVVPRFVSQAGDMFEIGLVTDPAAAGALATNTDAPAISGTILAGQTVSASNGTWTNTPESYTYRWLVSDDGSTGWSAASGVSGTTTSYTIPGDYAGKYLKARVIAHNGSTWSEPAYSAVVWVPAPPTNTVRPAITGSVMVGQDLSASTGTWISPPADAPDCAYEWQVSDNGATWSAATGAGGTTATYSVGQDDDAKYLRVKVTATNDGGSTVAYSGPTGVVDMPIPTWTIDSQPMGVGVSGTVRIHSVLTSSPATWHYATEPLAYQWEVSDNGTDGWSNASGVGATSDQYEISTADSGRYLRVVQTASNRSHWASAESAATIRVPATPFNVLGEDRPAVSGTLRVGETLSASTGTWTNAPADASGYSYEWQTADGLFGPWTTAPGAGADTAEYDVDLTDDAKFIRVVVTADNGIGTYAANSLAVGPVDILAPTSSAVPEISGTAEIGSTLTASSGTWDFATDYAYAWQSSADGSTWEAASGAGASTSAYTVAAADAGRYLRVRVTGSNRVGELAVASEASTRVPSPASPVSTPTTETPAPVFSPAPGITVGETRGEAVLAAAVPAAGADLLRGANIWVRPTSKVEYVAESLPDGLKLVNGKLVATKAGTYKVQIKVKRANGTIKLRTIKIKVG